MEIDRSDEKLLVRQITTGSVILVLGAGASVGSKNRYNKLIRTGPKLAELLCREAGLDFSGEPLPMVVEAVVKNHRLSDAKFHEILRNEYCDTVPSTELTNLFKVCWRRLYSFNVDDTIENIPSISSGQRRRYFNGMIDRVADYEGPLNLQVIYLHGQASKPEHGLIFSESDYSAAHRNDALFWYSRAAQDYLGCPVFIGSQLDERVLWSEIERAKRVQNSAAGLGFLITPSKLTQIKRHSLRSKGIVHVPATLGDFVAWTKKNFSSGITPTDIVKSETVGPQRLRDLTPEDINAAHYLTPIDLSMVRQNLSKWSPTERSRRAQLFYRGFPPTWELAASDIPVQLVNLADISKALENATSERHQFLVVTGQSGSGKTTALMMALLQYLRTGSRRLYEVKGDARSVRHIFSVLKKLDQPCIVYIGDLFLYGDYLADDLEQLKGTEILAISSSRSGEWNEHFSRRLEPYGKPCVFNRFVPADFAPLLERLNKYVAAPAFKQLGHAQQLKKLQTSRSQLLIAMHETTSSAKFAEVMANEFSTLPDKDTQRLCLIAGIATIARVGIGYEIAVDAYGLDTKRSLRSALDALAGIVEFNSYHRLMARHELYVREIVERVVSFDDFTSAICNILRAYSKYEIPIIRRVNRTDGHLFKTIMNADFIWRVAKIHNRPQDGLEIYRNFELDFQLDGHYWLQYGLYFLKLNNFKDSRKMLERSIEAYPENQFAQHALAHLKLRIVAQSATLDASVRRMLDDAVSALEELALSSYAFDNYPVVTLSMGHVAALATHNEKAEAREQARKYHSRLQRARRLVDNEALKRAENAMLRYVTLNEIPTKLFGPGDPRDTTGKIKRAKNS